MRGSGSVRPLPMPGASVSKIGDSRPHGLVRAADHQAVAALETEDTAAGADVHVVEAVRRQPAGSVDVVELPAVAAVDDDVASASSGVSASMVPIDERRRHHDPHVRGASECRHEIVERAVRRPRLRLRAPARRGAHVVAHALVPGRACRRRTMLAPMRPRPIIPSCMRASLARGIR